MKGPFSSYEWQDGAERKATASTLRRNKGGDLFSHHVLKLVRPQLSFGIAVQPVLRPRARTEKLRERGEERVSRS